LQQLTSGDLGGSTGIPRSDRKSELWSTSNHSEAASEQPSIHETYLASDKNQNLTPSTTEFKANPALSSGGREVQMLPGSQQVSPLQDFVHTAVGGNPSSGGNLQGQQIAGTQYLLIPANSALHPIEEKSPESDTAKPESPPRFVFDEIYDVPRSCSEGATSCSEGATSRSEGATSNYEIPPPPRPVRPSQPQPTRQDVTRSIPALTKQQSDPTSLFSNPSVHLTPEPPSKGTRKKTVSYIPMAPVAPPAARKSHSFSAPRPTNSSGAGPPSTASFEIPKSGSFSGVGCRDKGTPESRHELINRYFHTPSSDATSARPIRPHTVPPMVLSSAPVTDQQLADREQPDSSSVDAMNQDTVKISKDVPDQGGENRAVESSMDSVHHSCYIGSDPAPTSSMPDQTADGVLGRSPSPIQPSSNGLDGVAASSSQFCVPGAFLPSKRSAFRSVSERKDSNNSNAAPEEDTPFRIRHLSEGAGAKSSQLATAAEAEKAAVLAAKVHPCGMVSLPNIVQVDHERPGSSSRSINNNTLIVDSNGNTSESGSGGLKRLLQRLSPAPFTSRIRKKSGTPKLNGSVEKLVAEGVDGQQPVVGHQDGNGDRSRYSTEEQRLEKDTRKRHQLGVSNASFTHSSAETLTDEAAANEAVRGIAEMKVRTGEGTDRQGGDISRTQEEDTEYIDLEDSMLNLEVRSTLGKTQMPAMLGPLMPPRQRVKSRNFSPASSFSPTYSCATFPPSSPPSSLYDVPRNLTQFQPIRGSRDQLEDDLASGGSRPWSRNSDIPADIPELPIKRRSRETPPFLQNTTSTASLRQTSTSSLRETPDPGRQSTTLDHSKQSAAVPAPSPRSCVIGQVGVRNSTSPQTVNYRHSANSSVFEQGLPQQENIYRSVPEIPSANAVTDQIAKFEEEKGGVKKNNNIGAYENVKILSIQRL